MSAFLAKRAPNWRASETHGDPVPEQAIPPWATSDTLQPRVRAVSPRPLRRIPYTCFVAHPAVSARLPLLARSSHDFHVDNPPGRLPQTDTTSHGTTP
jgi:hypothetical protein